jgi:hypothetical protein
MLTRFIRFCDGMLGRTLSLRGVTEPTVVHIEGEVISEPSVCSPVSPVNASFIDWVVFGRTKMRRRPRPGAPTFADPLVERLEPLTRGRLGTSLVVGTDDGSVTVPLERALFVPHASIERNTQPFLQTPGWPVDEAIAALDVALHRGMELTYGERYLAKGDRVTLKATVAPSGRSGGGPYRENQEPADFYVIVGGKVGRPQLREIL